jgi:hypothetical protein
VINVNYFFRCATVTFADRGQVDEHAGDRDVPWVMV